MFMMFMCLFSGAAKKFPPVLQYIGDMWLHVLALSLLNLSILLGRQSYKRLICSSEKSCFCLHGGHTINSYKHFNCDLLKKAKKNNLVMQEKVVCNSTVFWLTLHSCTTLSWEQVASRLWSLFQKQLVTWTEHTKI